MDFMTRKHIEQLNNLQSLYCITIYMPTKKVGQDVLRRKDALLLKNLLIEVKTELKNEQLGHDEIEDLLAPLQGLINNHEFWRNRTEGLAMFLTNGIFKKFSLPLNFKPFAHVGNIFHLVPLLPMFTCDGSFYVLALELKRVRLYEQTRHHTTEVFVEDVIPQRMEERVGYDFEQKNLQFRSQHQDHGQASYHGHGESDRDRKNEISRYFRAIDQGLMNIIGRESKPLILACQDFLFPIYQSLNSYKNLVDDHIVCNLSECDGEMLRDLAWKKMGSFFDQNRKDKKALFAQYHGTGMTSSDIEQILPAAHEGKVDTLFLQNHKNIWGIYDPHKGKIRIDKYPLPSSVCLLNKAAIKTFLNGGKVFVLGQDEMPDPHARVNALYRY